MTDEASSGSTPFTESEFREVELRRLLEEAFDRPPEERAEWVETRASDPDLAREVVALLAREGVLGNFLERPVVDGYDEVGTVQPTSWDRELEDGTRVEEVRPTLGRYTLLSSLGAGGMGRVFLAEQQQPVERRVALKVARHRLIGRFDRHRFHLERQALARLSHPNIAQLFEAGATEEGRPFVAMEVVDGPPITTYCDRKRLPNRQRLELFVEVCRGVQHAHHKQILHRDLKPSNVLVTEVDGRPVPKIIDFGIAKELDSDPRDDTLATGDRILGTPHYMSPESLEPADSEGPDTRSDVYSLGVLLYELLTGVRPFASTSREVSRLLREIQESDPERPSRRIEDLDPETLQRISEARDCAPEALRRHLAGDLDRIVMKAIARPLEARYPSPEMLAADVERHLRNEPIEARPPTLPYVLGRLVRRHRGPVLAVVSLVLALGAGVVARTLEARRAALAAAEAITARDETRRALATAESARAEADQVIGFLSRILSGASPLHSANADPRAVADLTALELLERGVRQLDGELSEHPLTKATLLIEVSEIYAQLALHDQARPLVEEALQIRREVLGEDHPAVANGYWHLGQLYLNTQDLEAVEGALEQSRRILEAVEEPPPRDLVITLTSLARLWRDQGRFEAAEELYLEAIAVAEVHLPSDEPMLANAHVGLGVLYRQVERWGDAERHFLRGYEVSILQLPAAHPRVLTTLGNLAVALASQGKLAEAAPRFEQVLAARREVLGNDHPAVAESLNNLGVLYLDLEEPEKAVGYHRQALAIREQALGPDHPRVAWSLRNLAVALRHSESEEPTEPLLRRAIAIWQASRSGHPDLAEGYNSLANLHRSLGETLPAITNYERALVIWEATLGPDHPKVVRTRERLAGLAERSAP